MAKTNLGRLGMTLRGGWQSTATYTLLDVVSYENGIYVAKGASVGKLPSNNVYWQPLVDLGSIIAKGEYAIDTAVDAADEAQAAAALAQAVRDEVTAGVMSFAAPKWERMTPWAGMQRVPAAAGSLMSVTADEDCTVMHWCINDADPDQIAIGTVSGTTGGTQSNSARVRTGFLPVNGSVLYPYAGVPETLRQYAIACYRSDYSFIVSLMSGAPDASLPDDCVYVRLIFASAVVVGTAITADELASMKRYFAYAQHVATYAVTAGVPFVLTSYEAQNTLIADAGNIQVAYSPSSCQMDRDMYVKAEASGAVAQLDGIVRDTGLGVTAACVAEQDEVPTPEAPVAIVGTESVAAWVCGKNLADPMQLEIGSISTSTGGNTSSTIRLRTGYLRIANGVMGAVSGIPDTLTRTSTAFYDAQKRFLGTPTGLAATAAYVRNIYRNAADATAAITADELAAMRAGYQYELGDVASAWEAYRGNSYQVALDNAVYGLEGAADSVDLGAGVVTRRSRLVTFNGTEAFVLYSNQPADTSLARFRLQNVVTYAQQAKGITSHFAWSAANTAPNNECVNVGASTAGTNMYLIVKKDRMNGWDEAWDATEKATALKAWLAGQATAGTPVQVLYELAVPTTEAIPPVPVSAYEGANTVYSNGENVTAAGLQRPAYAVEQLQLAIDAILQQS